ncbi:MAG: hypothetical protein A2161_08395 [Candidatus Schekmanbacteria bacterium RBG_13_48_7]|uniref:Radical SAM core domain-containing protein n=1 Tax=Candidatus Schekmanbacteria bacterium RBG_13_48_7 TaxID=1817878 RepID=A0A1F7RVU8_9BACT|nr:MAG: hypothetical protein A2161_08395 [Candidatus Schekmanbacteria bacterium RBG_13_48_7]
MNSDKTLSQRVKISLGALKHHAFNLYKNVNLKFLNQNMYNSLLDQIQKTHKNLIFREPTKKEISLYIYNFINQHKSFQEVLNNIQTHKAYKYMGIRPLSLEMDVTNQCNLRCTMCPFSHNLISKRKREDISIYEFQKIAEQIFPFVNRLNLSISTEPLLHKQFDELVSITRLYKVPKICINTNGMLMNEKISNLIVDASFFSVGISIDSATSETYERIRKGGKFDRLLSNIQILGHVKKQKNSYLPFVTLNFVMMRSNISELPSFIRLAHNLNVNGVGASHMVPFDMLDMEKESLVHDKTLCNRILDESRKIAAELNIEFRAPENFQLNETIATNQPFEKITERFDLNVGTGKNNCYCPLPLYFVGIDSDGNVIPCGYWYSEKPLGNIKTQTFFEIWQSDIYQALRSELMNGHPRETCRNCPSTGIGKVDNEYSFKAR